MDLYDNQFVNNGSPILSGVISNTLWYNNYPTNDSVQPGILFNVTENTYNFTFGPLNSQGYKMYPLTYTAETFRPESQQPRYYYTTNQLKAYTYITSIVDSTRFYIYLPTVQYFPTPPFYFHYIVLDKTSTPEFQEVPRIPFARIKERIKIIALTEEGLCTTAEEHELQATSTVTTETESANYPMLGFYRTNIDSPPKYIPNHTKPPDIEEMQIEMNDHWQQWSIRPITFHQISPLRAFTYVDVNAAYNWMFPIPYPEITVDTNYIDPQDQYLPYGYDTPRVTSEGTFLFGRMYNDYTNNGHRLMPIARSFTYLPTISWGFGQSSRKWVFKMTNTDTGSTTQYSLYKKELHT